ncbi:phosphatase PAP2 family protein [Nocardia uniformis]|uniref:Phosphatase PAP2 family protein n=1 Tax=Nocardia uniformis TaxID=53432 RepID=A0A849BYH6_9NOCA|nr:phosphatase PAP2 family protein [Nocardia uniformis]NNH69320.1 phosphatase PAP2 family protein [Nocardia uniformis]
MTRPERSPIYLWLAAAGVTLTTGAAGLSEWTVADRVDRWVFGLINGLPDLLYRPMWAVQLLGVLGAPLIAALAALALRRPRVAIALIFLVPAKLFVEHDILKAIVHRPRPGATISTAILRDVPTAGSAFPSGHAVILFGMTTLLVPYLGHRTRLAMGAAVVAAGFSRIYLGAHTPLDVIGGAGAGIAIGALLTLLVGVTKAAAAPRSHQPQGLSAPTSEPKASGARVTSLGRVRIHRREVEER